MGYMMERFTNKWVKGALFGSTVLVSVLGGTGVSYKAFANDNNNAVIETTDKVDINKNFNPQSAAQVFNADKFLLDLPHNDTYKMGEAPDVRIKYLRGNLSKLEKDVTAILHHNNPTEQDVSDIKIKIDAYKEAVEGSSPSFPDPTTVQYTDYDDFWTYIRMYNVGESDVKDAHSKLKTYTEEFSNAVNASLDIPGSSKNEKIKLHWYQGKKPVDNIVKNSLDTIKNSLAAMNTHAERIRKEGNTIVTEGQMEFNNLKVSRKENEPDNSSQVINAVMAHKVMKTITTTLDLYLEKSNSSDD